MSQTILRRWHTFTRNGQSYIYSIERGVSNKVTDGTVALLRSLENNPDLPLTEDEEIELLKLELVQTPDEPLFDPVQERTALLKPTPVTSLTLFVAQQCNSRCVYCYGGAGEYGDAGLMDEQTAFTSVDWLISQAWQFSKENPDWFKPSGKAKKPRLSIAFFGGEPLLNFSLIKKVVADVKSRETDFEFSFAMSSNCSLMDDERTAWFQEQKFKILIGFDGPPDIQNRNRLLMGGLPSYDVIAPKILKIIAALPGKVNLRATIWSRGDAARAAEHLALFNADGYQTVIAANSLHAPDVIPSDPPGSDDFIQDMSAAADDFLNAVKERDMDKLKRLSRWMNFRWVLNVMGPQKSIRAGCGVGRSQLAVSTDGWLYPCHRFVGHSAYRVGTIYDPALPSSRIEYPEQTLAMLRREPCASCWVSQCCDGGCIYEHLSRTGNRLTPSPLFCNNIRGSMEIAIYLEHELSHSDRAFLHENRIVARRSCPLDM